MSVVELPKLDDWDDPGPGWIHCTDTKGNPVKPTIVCQCGVRTGIAKHHVHADGRITRSFWHHPEFNDGCGWHVWLQLLDYDLGEFPPE